MMTVKELREWIATLSDDDSVFIDDRGLTLRSIENRGVYIEVGGGPRQRIHVEYSLDSLGDIINQKAFEASCRHQAVLYGYEVTFAVGLNDRETIDGEPVDIIVNRALAECIHGQAAGYPLVPALYDLDENGEAFDTHFFCSEECRNKSDLPNDYDHQGESDDYISGTECETCGKPVNG